MRPAFSSSNIDNCPARHTAEFHNLFQRHFPQGGPNPHFPLFALRIWVPRVDVWFQVNQSRFDVLKAIGFFSDGNDVGNPDMPSLQQTNRLACARQPIGLSAF
jgi:hypothetical protein